MFLKHTLPFFFFLVLPQAFAYLQPNFLLSVPWYLLLPCLEELHSTCTWTKVLFLSVLLSQFWASSCTLSRIYFFIYKIWASLFFSSLFCIASLANDLIPTSIHTLLWTLPVPCAIFSFQFSLCTKHLEPVALKAPDPCSILTLLCLHSFLTHFSKYVLEHSFDISTVNVQNVLMSAIIKYSHIFLDNSLVVSNTLYEGMDSDKNTLSCVRHVISNYRHLIKGSITTWLKLEWWRLDPTKRCNTNQFCKNIQCKELMSLWNMV